MISNMVAVLDIFFIYFDLIATKNVDLNLDEYLGSSPFDPDAPGPIDGPTVPQNLMTSQGSPVPLLQFHMSPGLILLTSSWSKRKEPKYVCMYVCMSEANFSHSQRKWPEVSSSVPHLLLERLLFNPPRTNEPLEIGR
jgi:hypothetical protein